MGGEVARIQSSIEETKAAGGGSTNLFKLGTFEGKLKEVRAKITAGKSKVETLFEKAGDMKAVLNTKANARRASRAKGKAPTAAAAVATCYINCNGGGSTSCTPAIKSAGQPCTV
jgi:hypothetical protein